MKKISLKNLIAMAFCLFLVNSLSAQIVVDFEGPGTSTVFGSFGGAQYLGAVANPDPTGINTSATVGEYFEPVAPPNPQCWAGITSANPLPAPLDFVNYSNVCVKVYAPAPGNMLFKAEAANMGGTWEQLQDITVANQWVEICFDGTQPDAATGGAAAAGRTFNIATLFFDFACGTGIPDPPTSDKTWYFDDIRMDGAAPPPPPGSADITLCVDLACLSSATAPSVFGSFNGWCANCNPVTDPDGDGIFCATVLMQGGGNEYKFFQQGGEEMFVQGDPCTVTNSGFTNRFLNVTGVPQTLTFGWNSCDATCIAPPASADITFCVDLSCLPSATAPSVFGGFNGWCANCNFLSDPDGDDIWCTTVVNVPGGDQEYKFFIQEGEEQFAPGEPCTVTNFGFTNRVINVLGINETVSFGWNSCDASCVVPLTGQDPTVAAPDPTCNPGNVISMFSNSYTDVPVDTWLTVWSAASLTDLQIAGNDTKLYENVNFLGIETTGPNLIDASGMMGFSIDVWIDHATTFRVKLVDFGADQSFGGGDDTESEIVFDNPPQEEWVTYYIPMANFVNLQNRDNIAQLILSGNPAGSARFFVDNVHFSLCPPSTAGIPTMGEWAMFLFALIMLSLGLGYVKSMQQQTVLAGHGVFQGRRSLPFDKAKFMKAMKYALGLSVIGFALIYALWGEIVPADFVGMALTLPVVAYLIHLFGKEEQ